MRKGLLNAFLENDLDAAGHKIINLAGSGAEQGGMSYVDSSIQEDIGEPGTANPFKTIEAALAATPAGYNIIVRPGTYTWDGFIEVDKSVKIFGYGAIVSPATTHHAGMLVTADDAQIHGLEFDGLFAGGSSDDGTDGCVAIFGGTNAVLRDLIITGQHNTGIELRNRYSGTKIDGCRIEFAFKAISAAAPDASVSEIIIIRNRISNNRNGGIQITGDGNAHVMRVILISDNILISNDLAGANTPAIALDGGGQDISILSNQLSVGYDGINLTKTLRAIIDDNTVVGFQNNLINIFGHRKLRISGNILDGANAITGAALSENGIVLSGDYSAANDSSGSSINDNDILNIAANGHPISLANVNEAKVSGNRINGSGGNVLVQAYVGVEITDNRWTLVSNDHPITLDAAARTSSKATIRSNHFAVAAPVRLIATADLTGAGHDDIQIIANTSPVGKSYSSGTIQNVSGTAPTNVLVKGNSPLALGGPTTGWQNDDDPRLRFTVYVSKQRGNNTAGIRESRAHPFATINAAITAAASGDTVYVLDGVFDELIGAKDGITVRFMPEATLVCTTANGCITTQTTGDDFFLYHEHAEISSSKAGQIAILIAHTGSYRFHIGGVINTGTNTGTICHAIAVNAAAAVQVHLVETQAGNGIVSTNGTAITMGVGGTLNVRANYNEIGASTLNAISNSSSGIIHIDDAKIYSGGNEAIVTSTATAFNTYKNCSIQSFGTGFAAVKLNGADTFHPIFRDCVLVAEGTATKSINCTTGTHTVVLMGTMVANKGANPPTSVTFAGGGTYVVDAGVVMDWY